MRILPTVTECIGPWVDWSKIPPSVLLQASERGTLVHDVCLNYHAKNLPYMGGIPADVRGYIESFDGWLYALNPEIILIEERLFDEANGYCGQIDLLCLVGGEPWLVDLKTPLTKSKSWRVQIASYDNLVRVRGYKPGRCGSLRLRPDGKIPAMDWYEGSAAQDFNIFLSALNCYRYFNT